MFLSGLLNRNKKKKKEEVKEIVTPALTEVEFTPEQKQHLDNYKEALETVTENIRFYEEPITFKVNGVEREPMYYIDVKAILYPVTFEKLVDIIGMFGDEGENGLLQVVHPDREYLLGMSEADLIPVMHEIDIERATLINMVFLKVYSKKNVSKENNTGISTDFRKKD